jgi:hypothetical protein
VASLTGAWWQLMDRQQYVSALNQANELGKLAGFTS